MKKQTAAFGATYSDWKLVRGRKVVQIVFEVPLEAADHAYQVVGGMPDPGGSVWFAIARMKKPSDPETKKTWDEMGSGQQAGMLCNDIAFIKYLQVEYKGSVKDAESAAAMVRELCGVPSRSEIDQHPTAQKRWCELVTEYHAWMHDAGAAA